MTTPGRGSHSTKRMLHQLAHTFMKQSQSSQLLLDNATPSTEQHEQYISALGQSGIESRQHERPKRSKTYAKYSEDLKRSIILRIDADIEAGSSFFQTIRSISEIHGIHRKNIQRWYANAKEAKAVQRRGKRTMFPRMEQKLIEFISGSCRITRKQVIAKGRQLILQQYGQSLLNNFRGSNRWYYSFIRRHAELMPLLLGNKKGSASST